MYLFATIVLKTESLLEAHALIEAHSPVWTPKMPIFQANFHKNWASNKDPPMNIEKNKWCYVMQKHLEFVIKQRISSRPPSNLLIWPLFDLSGNNNPS